mmetsp:Transcript_92825/g.268065  ORF Transcript_92825/g.268065 Transcript_92825/m.268065 type:complete len:129 (+) Transcript_92825:156-542(+)
MAEQQPTTQAQQPIMTKAERATKIRRDKLEMMAVQFYTEFKQACKQCHQLGRYSITWGAVIPAIIPSSDEDLDEVLELFAGHLNDLGLTSLEWCNAPVRTTWQEEPVRHGSHVHLRAEWQASMGARFG